MKIVLYGLRSDEGQVKTDLLLERSAIVVDEPNQSAFAEVFSAKEAIDNHKLRAGYSKYVVALEPDEE